MLDRIQLKREAKELTRSARVSAYWFTLIYLVIINVLDAVNTYVSGSLASDLQTILPEIKLPAFLLLPRNFDPALVLFITVMVSLLSSVLYAGYTLYHLGVRRGEQMGYASLFDGFSFVGKVILLDIVTFIYIFLWSLLLVIPGIIAAYRYRFAVYNLCENPEMGVLEAMGMSSRQTHGHKADLFILDLTFLGWNLLCGLTVGILSIWIAPYVFQTDLGYFQEIKKMTGIGWLPPQEGDDGQFHSTDPFGPGF